MNKKPIILLCAILFALTSIQVLPAEEGDNLFNAFLFNLIKKREEIKNISMPDIEVHDVLIYATRSNYEMKVILFSPDMIQFIWTQVLGF